eukprot:1940497-Amphidinium_carterae.2
MSGTEAKTLQGKACTSKVLDPPAQRQPLPPLTHPRANDAASQYLSGSPPSEIRVPAFFTSPLSDSSYSQTKNLACCDWSPSKSSHPVSIMQQDKVRRSCPRQIKSVNNKQFAKSVLWEELAYVQSLSTHFAPPQCVRVAQAKTSSVAEGYRSRCISTLLLAKHFNNVQEGAMGQSFAKFDTTALRRRLTQVKATTQLSGDMLGASANSAMIDSEGSGQRYQEQS